MALLCVRSEYQVLIGDEDALKLGKSRKSISFFTPKNEKSAFFDPVTEQLVP